MSGFNWAGTYEYGARALHRPSTWDELRALVARAPRVRVLGSRHSFNGIADSTELVSLDRLPAAPVLDRAARTVAVGASASYGALATALASQGMALHNLASLPHISVAGAVATATHGSGDANGNLATAVAGLELVTSGGDVLTFSRGDPDFDGVVVGLGALGAVTRLTLAVEPAYEVRQHVFRELPWDRLFAHFDAISASGYSVSVFTRWGDAVDMVWVKRRATDAREPIGGDLLGAPAATTDLHPIAGFDPAACSPQRGISGAWWDRLPHFRMGFTPSAADEIQSEYLLPRRHAVSAIDAVRALSRTVRPLLHVSEIRTIAADRLWMSPQYGRDAVGIHFTWRREPAAVERAVAAVEAALAPFEARPHWGKLFVARAAEIGPLYARLPDFVRLAERLDPRGAFRNDWLCEHVLGA